jgi:serine/threonine-protein kinase
VVTAVAAALLGTAALNTLGAGILGPSTRTLSQSEVRDRLAGSTAPSVAAPSTSAPATPAPVSTPSETGAPTTDPPPVETAQPGGRGPVATSGPGGGPPPAAPQPKTEVLATAGGTIVAECTGDQVTLRSWSPAQGYGVHDVDRGPASRTRIRFRGDSGEVRVEITCVGGAPKAATRVHD